VGPGDGQCRLPKLVIDKDNSLDSGAASRPKNLTGVGFLKIEIFCCLFHSCSLDDWWSGETDHKGTPCSTCARIAL